jgi:hypothetical protein
MKETIKNIIITSKSINICYAFILRCLHKKSKIEIKKRGNLSIFDYQKLIEEIPIFPKDIVIDNNYYGLSECLKKFINTKKPLNSYIEHGLFLGSLVKGDSIKWCVPTIITFSSHRCNHIKKKCSKKILKIGPYIHYADDFITQKDFFELKQKIGKTLLIFPSHSIKNIETSFNNDELITFIKLKENNFDTVVICLYWRDALNNALVNSYKNCGYKITSAGHINDSNFLSRLKSIIKLSDFVISNSVGTHIGYINYLKKPQMIYKQTVDYVVNKNDQRAFTQRNKDDEKTLNDETSEILKSFANYSFIISQEQIDVIEKYWGLSEIKTKKELSQLILN